MNENKKQERRIAKIELQEAGITYESLNNDLHWKIGSAINFYPTTGRWRDEVKDETGQGTRSLIRYIKKETRITQPSDISIKQISVPDLLKIASKVQPANLINICEAIHKAVYK